MNRKERRLAAKVRRKSVRGEAVDDGAELADAAALANVGRFEEAAGICRRLLSRQPNLPDPLVILALVAHRQGRNHEALDCLRRAVEIEPGFTEAHVNMGLVLMADGDPAGAAGAFEKAAVCAPGDATILYRLGEAYQGADRLEHAQRSFRNAATLKPDFAKAHCALGIVLEKQEDSDGARESYERACSADPRYGVPQYNLGVLLEREGNYAEAATRYERALGVEPEMVVAHNNLGNVWVTLNRRDDAIACYEKAIAIDPTFADGFANLGSVHRDLGNLEQAETFYQEAIRLRPERIGWQIQRDFMLPVIPESTEEIRRRRNYLSQSIERFRSENICLADPFIEIGKTNFYAAYHELDDQELQKSIASLYLKACPDLAWTAPHCVNPKPPADRLRVGFFSAFMRDHTIAKLNRGFIENLSRDEFEVVLFSLPGSSDEVAAELEKAADEVVVVRHDLARAREIIAARELDILYFPEIGMDPFTYFVAMARLAPVQVATWGHPDTTGIPNIDYFLAGSHMEPEDGASHYSEKLVCLSDVTTFYPRPNPPSKAISRQDFGLPETGRLYLCPQTLFKFHPDFDSILREILEADPDGWLVLIDDPMGGHWRRRLIKRFESAFPAAADRVIFTPKVPREDFFGLLTVADVVIDIPSFSGGNSSIEAFALGVPVVTLPGRFLRGRITAACYHQMGLEDFIARDPSEFVSRALEVAQNEDLRIRMSTEITRKAGVLFENQRVIDEFEAFLSDAYRTRYEASGDIG